MGVPWEDRRSRASMLVIYNTIGRSIASIYDLGIFTWVLHTSVNTLPQIVYINYRPPCRTIYITHRLMQQALHGTL